VARGQYFVRIDPHNKVDDLVGGDFAEPVRSVWGNDDDIAGTDLAAHTALNAAAASAGTIEHGHHRALGLNFSWIVQRTAGYKCSVSFNHMVDLGDLGVLDAAGSIFAGSLSAVNDADADVVLAVDIDDANGLVADAVGGRLLHEGLRFRAAGVRRDSAFGRENSSEWQPRTQTQTRENPIKLFA